MRCPFTLALLLASSIIANAQSLPYPTASDWTAAVKADTGFNNPDFFRRYTTATVVVPMFPERDHFGQNWNVLYELQNRWIFNDVDRLRLFQIIVECIRTENLYRLRLALSLLDDHTHVWNIPVLMDALVMLDKKNPSMLSPVEHLLLDNLFTQEQWLTALAAVEGNELRKTALDRAFYGRENRYAKLWVANRIRECKLDPVAKLLARIDPATIQTIDYSQVPFSVLGNNPPSNSPTVRQPDDDESKLLVVRLGHDDDAMVKKSLAELKRLNIDASTALRKLACDATRKDELRLAAYDQIIQPAERLNASRFLLNQQATPDSLRLKVLNEMGKSANLLDLIAIKDSFITVKEDSRLPFARTLALTRDGSELLLAAIAVNGKLAAVLRDDDVLKNLKAAKVRDLEERLKAIQAAKP